MRLTVDGAPLEAPAGVSVAAALLEAGRRSWRTTRRAAAPRGLFCGIGVCFDCLVTLNGQRGVRACLVDARDGDRIETGTDTPLVAEPPAAPSRHQADLAVVGAGPAGLAAAVAAADAGCSVTVLDQGERVGGQYWRWGPRTDGGAAHHGWATFAALRSHFSEHQAAGRIRHLAGHEVFRLEPSGAGGWRVQAVAGERQRGLVEVAAPAALVATGAYDRPVPFPGWTLPGVLTAGGAQSLLKGSGTVAGRRVVVAGTGPFLLAVAAGLVSAGAQVAAVVEATRPGGYLRHPRTVAGVWPKLGEAAGYLATLAHHRVPLLAGQAVVAADGDDRGVRSVTVAAVDRAWVPRPGTERQIAADLLATGYGFVPQVELLADAGARLAVGPAGTAAAVVDAGQQTSRQGLFAAGETTGVGGADLAVAEGTAAGLTVARRLGRRTAAPSRTGASPERLRRFGDLMDRLHAPPAGWVGWQQPDTVVCRCEEVTVADLSAAHDLGADDARSAKLLARPGMGWCQGRTCGLAVAGLVAHLTGTPPTDTDLTALVHRPLAQPVPLNALAQLADPPPPTS